MLNLNNHTHCVLDTFKLTTAGIFLKDFHVERSLAALRYLGKDPADDNVNKIYTKIEKDFRTSDPVIGRLIINAETLSTHFETKMIPKPPRPVILQIPKNLRQPSGLGLQSFKWSQRSYWDSALNLISTPADDVLSLNELNNAVETSRYNLFFFSEEADSVYTPPLSSGCVRGTYRAWALKNKFIHLPELGLKPLYEMDISAKDFKKFQLFVANSVREVLSAKLLA